MDLKKNYCFKIGTQHARKKVESNDEYFDIALKAHEYLESFKVEEDGVYWALPDKHNGNGSTGVVLFYIQLYKLTKDEKYLEIIKKAADFLDKNWNKSCDAAIQMLRDYEIYDDLGVEYNYYSGAAAAGEHLIAIYQITNREKEKEAIRDISDYLVKNHKEDKDGVYWGVDCTMFHDAGTMIFLYHAAEILGDSKLKELAEKTADRIVANHIEDPRGGYAWTSTLHQGFDRIPNFEGGTAGTGYALTVAYEYSQKESYKEAAIQAAIHLRAISVPQGKGYLIPWHDVPGEEPIFYLANCHGPAGTSKLFYGLYEITNDEAYLDDIKSLYYGLRHLGAPEKMSPGYWNSVCVCCGAAGILQFLLNVAIVFKGTDFAKEVEEVATTAAEILVGEQESKIGGRIGVWPIAYERIKPENVAPNFDYFTGSAGIGESLLRIYQYNNKDIKFVRLIDDPYPTDIAL